MANKKIIRLSKSCLGTEEKISVSKVLDNEYLGMGEIVQNFENILENYFQKKVICVANGTAALQLALEACNIGDGDEVLVQSLTYLATFQAISATGAKPIACEIDPNSLTIDITDVKKKMSRNVKAIMPVHYSGGVGNLGEIYDFAQNNSIRIIEIGKAINAVLD